MSVEKDKITVGAAAIVRNNGKILIAQRRKNSKLEADKWEFPGGKVEFLEDPKETVAREVKEELDLDIRAEGLFDVVSETYEKNGEKFHVILIFHDCVLEGNHDRFRLIDAQDARWVKAEELENYDFAKADLPIVKKIKDKNSSC